MSSIQPLSQISIEQIQYDAKIRNQNRRDLERQYDQDTVELSDEAIRRFEESDKLKEDYTLKPEYE